MFEMMFTDIVKIKMNKDSLVYTVILPGIAKENVSISITNDELIIETKEKTAFGNKFYYKDNYNYNKLYLVEKTTSTLVDGVLTIVIPAKQQKQSKIHQIKID